MTIFNKHGVALLMQWIKNKDSFLDADNFLTSLKKSSKEELIKMLTSLVEDSPDLALKLKSEANMDKKVNLDSISERIDDILPDYICHVVPKDLEKLENIKERILKKLSI